MDESYFLKKAAKLKAVMAVYQELFESPDGIKIPSNDLVFMGIATGRTIHAPNIQNIPKHRTIIGMPDEEDLKYSFKLSMELEYQRVLKLIEGYCSKEHSQRSSVATAVLHRKNFLQILGAIADAPDHNFRGYMGRNKKESIEKSKTHARRALKAMRSKAYSDYWTDHPDSMLLLVTNPAALEIPDNYFVVENSFDDLETDEDYGSVFCIRDGRTLRFERKGKPSKIPTENLEVRGFYCSGDFTFLEICADLIPKIFYSFEDNLPLGVFIDNGESPIQFLRNDEEMRRNLWEQIAEDGEKPVEFDDFLAELSDNE